MMEKNVYVAHFNAQAQNNRARWLKR